MTPELQRALRQYIHWFGSYKSSGVLKKTEVWSIVRSGCIEFITPSDTYKVQRVRRNPRVTCFFGREDGQAISGTAEILDGRWEILRVYRAYWKTHPPKEVLRATPRILYQTAVGRRVLVRVRPDAPNPLAGITDPA